MGVDFSWGGSSSYPRYYEEVEKIATQCFGAVLNSQFVEDEKKVEKSLINPTYMFLQEADRLSKPSDENKGNTRKPSFDWGDAMQAAKDLEGVVFPQNFVEQKQKAIAQG